MQGAVEFLSVASCVHGESAGGSRVPFSTSSNGQELFCLLDAGYLPNAQAVIRDKDTWISQDDILATSIKAGRG
jgi:hypothetical protein